jgi:phytol kinase
MLGLIYSYLFVFAILLTSELLHRKNILSDEGSRKFIHIGVGNWIVVAPLVFDSLYLILIPPITFIILNYLSFRFDLVKSMERKDKSFRDLGTVYYAISYFLVILFDVLLFDDIKLAILPMLIMAYGDGLSAVIGHRFRSVTILGQKSLYGTLTMFIVSLILGILFLNTWWMILLVAVVSTGIELLTPRGFDNLTLPLGVYLILLILL